MGHTDDVLNAAATYSATWVGSDFNDYFAGTALRRLQVFGYKLAQHITREDGEGVFVPADVVEGDKKHFGGVLLLDDRAIIGWSAGRLRMKEYAEVVRFGDIRQVEQVPANSGTRVVIQGQRTWTILVGTPSNGQRDIAPLLCTLLDGQPRPEPSAAAR